MRQPVKAAVLGALMTGLCLLVGGTCACKDTRPKNEIDDDTKFECRQVVGVKWGDNVVKESEVRGVRVWRCYDPLTGECFLLANNGGVLEVPCVQHPFAEAPNEER